MRTAQQLFDTVVTHLRAQHARSQSADTLTCLYRSPDNLKCAVGALIPDEVYAPDMECSLYTLIFYKGALLTKELHAEFSTHFDLLQRLQTTHDKVEIEDWENEFKNIAALSALQYTPPEQP